MANRISKRIWRNLAIVFGLLAAVLIIITIFMTTTWESKEDPRSAPIPTIHWFQELQPSEIKTVLKYLEEKSNISLLSPENARLNGSFVHYIELKLPPKKSVLNYLYLKGPKPNRLARVAIFRGDLTPPVVEEYYLWPLPNITSMFKYRTVSYSQRPLLLIEMAAIYVHVVPKFEAATSRFLKKEYDTLPSSCLRRCLDISFTPVPSTVATKSRRQIWIWFNLKSIYKLHPLDFQFEVDITSPNPSEWTLKRVWFEGSLFDDTKVFMYYYINLRPKRTPWYQRKQPTWDSLTQHPQIRTLPIRDETETKAKKDPRYKITDNFSTVTYLNWKFHLHLSPTGGLRLLNVRFREQMIVYEMNLQEVGVIYSGKSPAAQNFNFVDGTALFGSRIAGLVEGVDCPSGATFLSPTIYTVNDKGFKVQQNAACIFEHDSQVPLRRHKISVSSREYYKGIPDKVLIVRVILAFLSYDYIMDYVFHNNGAIESRVFSTGTLITTTLSPADKEYGIQIDPFTVANIHNHLFNYKVDLDILGVNNRHSIWNLDTVKVPNVWSNHSTADHYTQDRMSQTLIRTEMEARYIFDFQKPGYLLFHTGKNLNKNRYPRSYRILLSGLTPKTSEDVVFNSIAWAETQLAVTKRKEHEETSSSLYALWDSIGPVVDFKRYLNNESIIDEDLVVWITIGFRHIPQMENIPCTMTLGTKSSFLLLPFNYFDEDPSITADDNLFFPLNKT